MTSARQTGMQHSRPAPWRKRSCAAAVTLAVVLGLSAPLSTAAAQDIFALTQQLDRLQREVQVLQRQVAVGQPVEGVAVPPGEAGPILGRLSSLETEIRRLTGRFEELSHRLDLLDRRLGQAEARIDTGLAAAQTTPPDGGPAPLLQGEQPGGPRVLGTLPQDAVPATPQPVQSDTASQTAALPAVTLPGTSAKDDYDYAFGLLRQADYPRAEAALRAFLEAHPDDALAGNAKYWLGETHYVRGQYQAAAVVFAEAFQEYPQSSKAPDNLLKLGMSLSNIGEQDDACKTFGALLQRYPDAAGAIRQRAEAERGRLGC